MATRSVTVLGATGYTGRLVVAELVRRGAKPVVAGRNEAKLTAVAKEHGGLPTMIADVTQPQSLATVAAQSQVIVNCAGPFVDLGKPVVDAAIEAGSHYLDTTGEQPFVRAVQELDRAARERGVAIVPAHAFEIALADCAAALLSRGYRDIASLEVVYATRFHASQGTKRSVLKVLGTEGRCFEGGNFVVEAPAFHRRYLELPEGWGQLVAVSFPGAEIVTIPRHVRTRAVRVYLALPHIAALTAPWVLPLVRGLLRTPVRALVQRALGSDTTGPPPEVRTQDRFLILIEIRGVRAAQARVEKMVLTGRDPYGITAALAAAAALRMCEPGYDARGVLSPAQAFDPEAVLQDASPFDLVVKRGD